MEKHNMRILGAAYIRTATDNPEQVDAQEESIAKYCSKHRIKIVETYKDIAQSGLDAQRPILTHVVTDADAGKFEVLIITSPDRIARDVSVYRQIISELRKHVRVEFSEVRDYEEDDDGVPIDVLNSKATKRWFDGSEEK